MSTKSHAQGCLLGAFIGDAAGATLEFIRRLPTKTDLESALAMSGGGIFGLAPGQITDDGELTLALARSLVGRSVYDADEVAANYRRWVASRPFDMGFATSNAMARRTHAEENASTMALRAAQANANSKANGGLMRCSGLAIWSTHLDLPTAVAAAKMDATLSHPNVSCQWANAAYAVAIRHLIIRAGDRAGAFDAARELLENSDETAQEVLSWINDAERGTLPPAHPHAGFVRMGFTYAFYCLLQNMAFLQALSFTLAKGGDTDTNACIVGGLIGAAVGADELPAHMKTAVLACNTEKGRYPRPEWLRTTDALSLAEKLLAAH